MNGFRRLKHKRVVVNLRSGETIRGYMAGAAGVLITLKKPELLTQNGGAVPVDGEVFVERDNVSFYQVLPL